MTTGRRADSPHSGPKQIKLAATEAATSEEAYYRDAVMATAEMLLGSLDAEARERIRAILRPAVIAARGEASE